MEEILHAINQVFRRHGGFAMAVIDHPQTGERLAFGTPSYYCLPVMLARKTPRERATALRDELADAVGQLTGQPVRLTFGRAPFGIYVARPDEERLTLPLGVLSMDQLKPFRMFAGRSYEYAQKVDHFIDLTDSNSTHVLIAGMTGMGKSVTLQDLLATLLLGTKPEDLEVYVVDPKHRSLKPFEPAPHVRAFADEPHETAYAIRHIFTVMRERRKTRWHKRIVLFIDELSELQYAPSALYYLERIIKWGREFGIHVVAATQRPSAKELATVMRSQFPVRIAGHAADGVEARLVAGQGGSGAEHLAGKGDMLLIKVGKAPVRIQTYKPSNVGAIVQRLNRRHEDYQRNPLVLPVYEEPESGDAVAQEQLQKARPVFLAHWNRERGKLKHGAQSEILRAVTGDQKAVLAGPNYDLVQEIVALLRGEQLQEGGEGC